MSQEVESMFKSIPLIHSTLDPAPSLVSVVWPGIQNPVAPEAPFRLCRHIWLSTDIWFKFVKAGGDLIKSRFVSRTFHDKDVSIQKLL